MIRGRSLGILASLAGPVLVALGAAACSSGGGGAGPGVALAPPSTTSGPPATLAIANSGLGQILVDAQGRTLYLFQKDAGTTSACSGACATAWPPLLVTGQLTPGSGASGALLGTTHRSDGGTQVTYNGHPVYRFIEDQKPGDTKGQGVDAFGARWFALTSAGDQVATTTSGGGASTSGGGGGGY